MSTAQDPSPVLVWPWPMDAEQRRALAIAHVPRVFVVDPDGAPPNGLDELEDWVRAPVDPDEVRTRAARLVHRHVEPLTPTVPVLESGDILRHRGRWVALSAVERAIVVRLLADYDHCVPRADLGDGADHAALNTRIKRIRHRIAPLGLTIKTVRARGFVLCDAAMR